MSKESQYIMKLSQLLSDVDTVRDMIKVFYIDSKINEREAQELLRLLDEATDRALN